MTQPWILPTPRHLPSNHSPQMGCWAFSLVVPSCSEMTGNADFIRVFSTKLFNCWSPLASAQRFTAFYQHLILLTFPFFLKTILVDWFLLPEKDSVWKSLICRVQRFTFWNGCVTDKSSRHSLNGDFLCWNNSTWSLMA